MSKRLQAISQPYTNSWEVVSWTGNVGLVHFRCATYQEAQQYIREHTA